ncbi:Tetratricopeptide repeat-containing protein [Arenibacter palladensis]|uniref:Tetratricopeptide repeat-containing protein n=1 Tax=Arenibacter palladensis TaxID=237373 RepID=A0A1M5CQB0_9FLAO|nr:tetratricopeptide repeat protein [Arenibacter palladensis]SHF56836.1 Tetratricopeptide repeat-containing protein [Arenibacter palladensis]
MIEKLLKIKKSIHQFTGFSSDNKNSFRDPIFILLGLLFTLTLFAAYSNHFQNGFHFDDSHTIEDNKAITEVNAVAFFKDVTTFSTLPSNRSYRPYTTLENAIDYKLGDGLDPLAFHIHIFIFFILTCAALFLFVKKLLDRLEFSNYNQFWGLLIAATFGLLCANAETVNYIIQRSEIVAGFYVLLGFVAFLSGGIWRKWHLYLIFPLIGFFSKEMALVFSPLLFLYFLIFEEDVDLLRFYRTTEFKKCIRSFIKVFPSFVLTLGFLIFYFSMLPDTFAPGGPDRYNYLITQPLVMCHYILTYFIPYNLSADTDWVAFESILDYRAILGIIGIGILIFLAFKTSKKKETKLFTFGLLWFFISLLPSSSVLPFAEVLNDHRSFIPYMGLTMAFVFGTNYILETYFPKILTSKKGMSIIALFIIFFLFANAYGVHQRNKVWKDEISLWKDVTVKSPKNGRGHMNYGLALMAQGDYTNAEISFNNALEYVPNYSSIYTNMGILKNAIGDKESADKYFQKSLSLSDANHKTKYFYGRYLFQNNKFNEAIDQFKQVNQSVPNYIETNDYIFKSYHKLQDWENMKSFSNEVLENQPKDDMAKKYLDIALNKKSILTVLEEEVNNAPSPEKYLNLSLQYFNESNYQDCIRVAEKSLELNPEYADALNNIGIGHFYLLNYDQAIEAYGKALEINPSYQLAKNNLENAKNKKKDMANAISNLSDKQASAYYINLSLEFYQKEKYQTSIAAARKSIAIAPNAIAYNNICSSYNQLKEYQKAIAACTEALKLDASSKLAKGNLNYAQEQMKNQ